jgi:hypothetical protein
MKQPDRFNWSKYKTIVLIFSKARLKQKPATWQLEKEI